jgi:hypothetical protein
MTCIRLDATVVMAHSDKELAEANFKGYGHHPLLACCDNTGGRWPGCCTRARQARIPLRTISQRTQAVCRLHRLLAELTPGGCAAS